MNTGTVVFLRPLTDVLVLGILEPMGIVYSIVNSIMDVHQMYLFIWFKIYIMPSTCVLVILEDEVSQVEEQCVSAPQDVIH